MRESTCMLQTLFMFSFTYLYSLTKMIIYMFNDCFGTTCCCLLVFFLLTLRGLCKKSDASTYVNKTNEPGNMHLKTSTH